MSYQGSTCLFHQTVFHIAIKYHHFREHVRKKMIIIHHVGTKDQLADIFTKPLPRDLFRDLRFRLLGW